MALASKERTQSCSESDYGSLPLFSNKEKTKTLPPCECSWMGTPPLGVTVLRRPGRPCPVHCSRLDRTSQKLLTFWGKHNQSQLSGTETTAISVSTLGCVMKASTMWKSLRKRKSSLTPGLRSRGAHWSTHSSSKEWWTEGHIFFQSRCIMFFNCWLSCDDSDT